jgi:hypothetical protein
MPRRKGVSPRPHQRKPNGKREQAIRDYLKLGYTDPKIIAMAEGCSKELVLYYCRQMTDVVLMPIRPGKARWRQQVFLRERIPGV